MNSRILSSVIIFLGGNENKKKKQKEIHVFIDLLSSDHWNSKESQESVLRLLKTVAILSSVMI